MSRRRLSAFDASFLQVESHEAHMHVGWAALFAPPARDRRPNFEELREHVAARLGRAPRYRQKLADVPLGMTDAVWIDDPDFDVTRHVRHARGSDFSQLVDEVLSVQLERDRPLWELWIADGLDDGRIGVVGKAHHCMVDGVAAVELSSLMLDPLPDAIAPVEPWHPPREPAALELMTEALAVRTRQFAGLATLPLRVAARPADALSTAVRILRAARSSLSPAPASPLNAPISQRRRLGRAHRPLEDFRAVKTERGGTVNDVLLAAVAGGLRRLFAARGEDPRPLKTMVPVSRRAEGAAGELGNQISFVFIELPCDQEDPVARLASVQAEMGGSKAGGEPEGGEILLGTFEYMPRPVQRVAARVVASPRTFNLVVSNIPGPPLPLYMRGCRLEEAYPVVPLADEHAVSIGMTTVCGEACLGIYADAETVPDADLLADAIAESIDELAPAAVPSAR
jgi:WS/DGAT/MGAT family acyltransferase